MSITYNIYKAKQKKNLTSLDNRLVSFIIFAK